MLGIHDDGWSGLSANACALLMAADLVIGVERMLAHVRPHLPPHCTLRAMDNALTQTPAWITAALDAGQQVVLLASGDPLCHGIGPFLIKQLGARVRIEPAPSTLQLACARFGTTWQDAMVASCHGRDAGEWEIGATPAHGLYPLMRAIARHPRVLAFTSPANDPARLARALILAGEADTLRLSVACRLRRADEAVFRDLGVAEVAGMRFATPNVVLVERIADPAPALPIFGLADDAWQQRTPERGLLTKQEARAVSLARLALTPAACVWDIGAGSGAVGLECARLAPLGHVWAIEKNAADAVNARANAARLAVTNYTLCEGRAPAGLEHWPDPDAVFIGGSDGELAALIALALTRLRPGGRLVMNLVTLENLATATTALGTAGVRWDVVQLQASRSQPILALHRLAAHNPVWIITATKECA